MKTNRKEVDIARPPVLIYKTRKDYSKNVPVNLSADRKSIISFPGIKDIYYGGELAYPAQLVDGYLLDNRGISQGVAFLDYTYEQYRDLAETPSAEELMKHIIDMDPLTELYSCKCNREIPLLNDLIKTGGLTNCKNLKL